LTSRAVNIVVVDTSVFADYYLLYPKDPERHERARAVLDRLSLRDVIVYELFLLEIELRAVLVRRVPPEQVLKIVNTTLNHVNLVGEEEIHDKAAEIALTTGCRAVDAYFIATAST
jgi:predicted nucleic acid-binding protein